MCFVWLSITKLAWPGSAVHSEVTRLKTVKKCMEHPIWMSRLRAWNLMKILEVTFHRQWFWWVVQVSMLPLTCSFILTIIQHSQQVITISHITNHIVQYLISQYSTKVSGESWSSLGIQKNYVCHLLCPLCSNFCLF